LFVKLNDYDRLETLSSELQRKVTKAQSGKHKAPCLEFIIKVLPSVLILIVHQMFK